MYFPQLIYNFRRQTFWIKKLIKIAQSLAGAVFFKVKKINKNLNRFITFILNQIAVSSLIRGIRAFCLRYIHIIADKIFLKITVNTWVILVIRHINTLKNSDTKRAFKVLKNKNIFFNKYYFTKFNNNKMSKGENRISAMVLNKA